MLTTDIQPNASPKKRAYVTLLSDDNYLAGVVTLAYSLTQHGNTHELIVMINDQLSENTLLVLQHMQLKCYRAPKLQYTNQSNSNMTANGWPPQMINTADKLSVFTLTEYDKLVYVDADMLVLKNIDFLFDCPHGSAAMDLGLIHNPIHTPQYNQAQCDYFKNFNSGLFVFEPNLNDYQTCLQLMQTIEGFDQEILRELWSHWQHTPALHLPQTCNVFAKKLTEYIRLGFFGFTDVHILHYTYQPKPWLTKDYQINQTNDFLYYFYREWMQKAMKHFGIQ